MQISVIIQYTKKDMTHCHVFFVSDYPLGCALLYTSRNLF